MMLGAVPAENCPTEITAASSGSTFLAHDGLQRRDEVGARHDGVDPLIRERPVDPLPLNDELEGVRVGVADPAVQSHLTGREIVVHVQGEDPVDPRGVQRPRLRSCLPLRRRSPRRAGR